MSGIELHPLLASVPDVDVSPSVFRDDDGYWVNGQEIAHVSGPFLEIRLGRALIRTQRTALRGLVSVKLRGSGSDWVDVSVDDVDQCLSLFKQAVEVYRPRPGELPLPPPTGAALARRRRFH